MAAVKRLPYIIHNADGVFPFCLLRSRVYSETSEISTGFDFCSRSTFFIFRTHVDTNQSLNRLPYENLRNYTFLWLSSPEKVWVTDEAGLDETSEYGPCIILLNVFSALEGTL